MEQNQGNMCGMCQGHKMGCCGRYHIGLHILRWILGIVVICMAFSLGMKVGEIKGYIGGEFPSRHMQYYGQPMMYGGEYGEVYTGGMMGRSVQVVPAKTVTTVKAQ